MAKRQKDKQRSKRHTHKTNDRVTRTPLKWGGHTGIFIIRNFVFDTINSKLCMKQKTVSSLAN